MYYFAKFIKNILLKAPLWLALLLGKIGGLMFYLNHKKRKVAFRNIKQAFPDKSTSEVKRILRRSFNNLSLSVVETLIAPRLLRYVEVRGGENISSQGGVLAGIHAGSWELYISCLAREFPCAVLVREQKKKSLDRFINELREERKMKVYFSLKSLIKALRDKCIVGLVIDQGEEDNALFVEFFSHLVPTPGGAAYLAKKFDREIYPAFGFRRRDFSHVVEVSKPIPLKGRDQRQILRDLNKFFEKKIEAHPSEYVWSYKRFKRKQNLDILVISDGKTGHLRQSQALVSLFAEENNQVRSEVIEVKYKNRAARILAECFAIAAGDGCVGCARCLNFILSKDNLRKIERTFADIVISTGSFSAPLNIIFSSYLGARSVSLLRPNITLKKFDLVILPHHDRLNTERAVKIKGALFYPQGVEEKTKACNDFFKLTAQKKVSFFLGGVLIDEEKFMENLKLFAEKLKDFSLNNNYKILISSSRRTPQRAEEFLEGTLGNFKNTEAAVYARRSNLDFIFDGFVSLSDIVFVSSESISMISETVSFKKPCVCVALERQDDKHKIFLESMEEELNVLRKPYNIEEIKLKVSNVFEENKKIVKQAIRKLL